MKKKKIGIVGLGGISQIHSQSLMQSEHGKLIGGVDFSPDKRKEFEKKWQCPTYGSLPEMLAAHSLDGVILATPPIGREELMRPALEAGCHILCEKPLAHAFENAKSIHKLAKLHPASRVHLGFCHRFSDAVIKARSMIEEGSLGKVVWINIIFTGYAPVMKERWFTDPAISGGGVAIDGACHALDLFRFLGGGSMAADGFYRRSWPGRGEDTCTLALRGDNGTLGSVMCSYLTSISRYCWEICGEEATLRYDYFNPGTELWKIDHSGQSEKIETASANKRFLTQCNAWVATMNGANAPLATLEDGLFIASVIDSLNKHNA